MKTLFSATVAAALCTAFFAPRGYTQGAEAAPGGAGAPPPVLPPSTNVAPAAPQAKPSAKPAASKPASGRPAAGAIAVKSDPVLSPEPAVARQNNVNVRGQATLNSEVVARLKKGDPVTVLEEVIQSKPKQDEPARWYRIEIPDSVGVWVHSAFVDQGSGTVKATRLNMRGGPGENYSVVGRLDKGTPVKVIDTKGSWMKIEPPTNAYAFVAAHLVERKPAPAIAAAPTPAPAPAPTVTPAPAVTTPPPTVTPVPEPVAPPPTVAEVTPPPTPAPAEAIIPVPAPAPTVTPAPAETLPPTVATPVPAPAEAEPEHQEPIETVRKVVTREGILKGSVSIQAPTYYELRSLDTGRTIDYVFSPSTNLVLKEFKGQRVIVTGEEVLDERWQNTPVLVVDSLQTVP